MKNKHIEKLIQSSKKYAKTAKSSRNWVPELKLRQYHCYDEKSATDLTYWDDVMFQMGSQMVVVFWVHPRYDFASWCQDEAHAACPSPTEDFFAGSTPNYRYVGKNKKRKRLVSHTLRRCSDASNDWISRLREKEKEIIATTEHRVRPFFKVEQLGYARGVSISCPIEIRNVTDLKQLADLVRDCLNDRTLFERKFGTYSYGSPEYKSEVKDDSIV